MLRKINNETPTKCICHKGFSVYSIDVARSNFRFGGQETAPQSLTAHTLDRYGALVLYFRLQVAGKIKIGQS